MHFKPFFYITYPFKALYRWFIGKLLKNHFKRIEYLESYVQLSKDMTDVLKLNNQVIATIQHKKQLQKLEKENENLEKELFIKRNNLIKIILQAKDNEHLNMTTKEGNPIDTNYLNTLSIEDLIDKSDIILKQLRKLDI